MLMMRWISADQKKSVRHWAMEFVIVVAGVLLALWLQQWGERQRALADMRSAEEAIHDEIRTTLESLMWRKAISQCHIDRQKLLISMLQSGGDSWPGLQEGALALRTGGPSIVIQSVYTRPLDSFNNAAWTSALATGALAPMDPERFGELVSIYEFIEVLRRTAADETNAAADLSPLAFPLRLTPELRAQMIEAVYRTDRARFTFGMVSPGDFASRMRGLGWDDTDEIDRAIKEDSAEAKAAGFVFRPCVAKMENPFRSSGGGSN